MLVIKKYSKEYRSSWNDFVKKSKNFHFFFLREYMDYHKDRFEDFSLMILNEKNNKILALLPANIVGCIVHSHQGLTFGGFIVDDKMKAKVMLEIFSTLKVFLREEGITKLIYKVMPHIYHTKPSEEDNYALFRNEGYLFRKDVTATINLHDKIKYQSQRTRDIKKALKNGLEFERSNEIDKYWEVLNDVLQLQHNEKSVHSLSEIKSLIKNFPNYIKLFIVKKESKILAGALVFETPTVAHTQYLASSLEGKELHALDLVLDRLISEVYVDKRFFDFGISNEDEGRYLNEGLIFQKEAFGARAITHDFYELEIK